MLRAPRLVVLCSAIVVAAACAGRAGPPAVPGATPEPLAAPAPNNAAPFAVTTRVAADELLALPWSRDPWGVLPAVASVIQDRVSVGGSLGARQATVVAKGAPSSDNAWFIDGVPITDLTRPGASLAQYDFDALQQIDVTTGGADLRVATAGVNVNLALRSGTNVARGSGRVYFTSAALQATNVPVELAAPDRLGAPGGKGPRVDRNADYGGEFGGPLVTDRWWAWGAAARADIRLRGLDGTIDRAELRNITARTQALVKPTVRAGFTFFSSDTLRFGVGAEPDGTRPDETRWNQSAPVRLYKGHADVRVRGALSIQAQYAHLDSAVRLTPRGGTTRNVFQDERGVWHNSFVSHRTETPQEWAAADASWPLGRHEIRFGGSFRSFDVHALSAWPGSKIVSLYFDYPEIDAQAIRDFALNTASRFVSAYGGDRLTLGRWTLDGGVRLDTTSSEVAATRVAGVPGFETLLPAIQAPAVTDQRFSYTAVSPRAGVAWAPGGGGTRVRASYATFASQLGALDVAAVSPMRQSYVLYEAIDRNGDGIADRGEILFNRGVQESAGFDPFEPAKLQKSPNRIGGVRAPRTQEVTAGIDRDLFLGWRTEATFTWRRFSDLLWSPLINVRRKDYVQSGALRGTLPDETAAFNVPFYALRQAAVPPGAGREQINREAYSQRYWGVEVSAVKRWSRRWSARVGFSTNDHREHFDNPERATEDPTPAPTATPSQPTGGPLRDSGPVLRRADGGARRATYLIAPKYQLAGNGTYGGPWGINLAANVLMRQGFAQPYFRSRVRAGDPVVISKSVLVAGDLDSRRLGALTLLDLRVEKSLNVARARVVVDFDIFNLLNAATILGREYDLRLTGPRGFNAPVELLDPRLARVGVRVTF